MNPLKVIKIKKTKKTLSKNLFLFFKIFTVNNHCKKLRVLQTKPPQFNFYKFPKSSQQPSTSIINNQYICHVFQSIIPSTFVIYSPFGPWVIFNVNCIYKNFNSINILKSICYKQHFKTNI